MNPAARSLSVEMRRRERSHAEGVSKATTMFAVEVIARRSWRLC
ncbi:hypothetical protein HMPREF0591_0338 [Mycobacterium parascrofulaceum ATCC BAA-614]|uniref:Uncharacterized protein n=1 Tax=Mycobacterium parascrofulaceum ATCC BAA-614 TaxID=525368 RepID=D5P2E4_9MYCO|nr:hypothetical protein HMPREF0591_0338 [Mycobacterium parascrofulaceum ATCC BAA-614]